MTEVEVTPTSVGCGCCVTANQGRISYCQPFPGTKIGIESLEVLPVVSKTQIQ